MLTETVVPASYQPAPSGLPYADWRVNSYCVFHVASRAAGAFTVICDVGLLPRVDEFQPVNTNLSPFGFWTIGDFTPTVTICPTSYQPLPTGDPTGVTIVT